MLKRPENTPKKSGENVRLEGRYEFDTTKLNGFSEGSVRITYHEMCYVNDENVPLPLLQLKWELAY